MATPVHILNIRDSESGGGVDQNALMPIVSAPSVVILIHGYNDSLTAAREAYAEFLNPGVDVDALNAMPPYAWGAYGEMLQGDTLTALSRAGEVCLFFWPGDKSWGPVSFASFPLELEPMRESADMLVKFLTSITSSGWNVDVTLIAHSLGNRLLLEAALQLGGPVGLGQMRIDTACMMAAAVPVPMVLPGKTLEPAAKLPGKTLVLYSGSDWVLDHGFPIEETMAGEGHFPEAVGHAGNPQKPLWTKPEEMPGYGHSSYWPGIESRSTILEYLDVAVAPLPQTRIAGRDLPPANAVESRTMVSQSIPGRTLDC